MGAFVLVAATPARQNPISNHSSGFAGKFALSLILDRPDFLRPELRNRGGTRVALWRTPHPNTRPLVHALDALATRATYVLSAAFRPAARLRGDKQDNMVEVAGLHRPRHGIPVFTLREYAGRPPK